MFNRPTVFVIGAGCSTEFELPLGGKLRDSIYEHCLSGSEPLTGALYRSGVPDISTNSEQKLHRFARGVHTKASIDQYLDFHKDDPQFVMIGKAAIAQSILEKERASPLASKSIKQGLSHLAGTWLMRLFYEMNAGTAIDDVAAIFNNVSFICFNYDRCLEVLLFNALKTLTGWSPMDLVPVFSSLRIWHPYGTVGRLRYEAFSKDNVLNGFPDLEVDWEDVLEGARQIKTFTERVEDAVMLNEMRGALSAADQVIYLGFSFIDQNMDLLRAPAPRLQAHYATTLGLSPANTSLAKTAMRKAAANDHAQLPLEPELWGMSAGSFMEAYGASIRR